MIDAATRYDRFMSHYSVTEAQADLPRLIEAAERGESVIIDRADPDVEVKIVARRVRPASHHDIEWLESVRVYPRRGPVNTAAALAEMKEERGR